MELVEKVQKIIDAAVKNKEVAGVNVLILDHGKEILYAESGLADIEQKRPLKRDAIFRMFSMSKPITSVGAMILVERGILDPLQPVSDYLPAYKELKYFDNGETKSVPQPMMIRDLLNMTAGLSYPDGSTATGIFTANLFDELESRLNTENEMTTRELADRLADIPLAYAPGTGYRYSTCADVLGAVIEVAAGKKFSEYLADEIFKPLGMKDTGFYIPSEKLSRRVEGYRTVTDENGVSSFQPYDWNNLGIKNRADSKPAFESGGAGIVSTIDDYARFASMLIGQGTLVTDEGTVQILKPETVRYMTGHRLSGKLQSEFNRMMFGYEGYTYSNLLRICTDENETGMICSNGEYGWDGWLGTYFENLPHDGITILMGTQKVDAGTFTLTRRVRNAVLSELLHK